MKKLLLGIGLILSMLTVIIILMPHRSPPKERMAASELMMCALSIRSEIENAILSKQPIPEKITSDCDNPPTIYWSASQFKIMPNGNIFIENKELNITINLVPSVKGSTVTWGCYGSPKKYMPAPCRENT